MRDFEGASPSDVIERAKYALTSAQLQAGKEGLGYTLASVALELTAVQSHEAGVGLKIKIPFVDWELDVGTKVGREHTQVISVELEPIPVVEDLAEEAIDMPLTEALLEIARIVRDAGQTAPKLGLKDASVELQFVFTRGGELKLLVFEGAETNVTTHKLKLDLKKA